MHRIREEWDEHAQRLSMFPNAVIKFICIFPLAIYHSWNEISEMPSLRFHCCQTIYKQSKRTHHPRVCSDKIAWQICNRPTSILSSSHPLSLTNKHVSSFTAAAPTTSLYRAFGPKNFPNSLPPRPIYLSNSFQTPSADLQSQHHSSIVWQQLSLQRWA